MSLRSEAVFDGEIALPIGVARQVWLPDLSGEDARIAWTMFSRGWEFGFAKIRPGDKGTRPRHWSLHRAVLEGYAKCGWLTDDRLARIVEGSRILSDDSEIHGVRMFEVATVKAGGWGYSSGRVVVQPTEAFAAWMKSQDQRKAFIPCAVWHRVGQKLALGLCVRMYGVLEEPRVKFAWDLKLEDLRELDPSLRDTALATIKGVYLKKAAAALLGTEHRYALRAESLMEGRKAIGVRLTGVRVVKGRKKSGGLDGMAGLSREPGYSYPPELTRQAALHKKAAAWAVQKHNAKKAAAKKARPAKLADIGRSKPAPVQPKLPFDKPTDR